MSGVTVSPGFTVSSGFTSSSGLSVLGLSVSTTGLKLGSASPQTLHLPSSNVCPFLGSTVPFFIILSQSAHTISPVYPSSVQVASFWFIVFSLACLQALITLPLSSILKSFLSDTIKSSKFAFILSSSFILSTFNSDDLSTVTVPLLANCI